MPCSVEYLETNLFDERLRSSRRGSGEVERAGERHTRVQLLSQTRSNRPHGLAQPSRSAIEHRRLAVDHRCDNATIPAILLSESGIGQ